MMNSSPWDKIDIANNNKILNGFLAYKNASIEFYWAKDILGNFLFVVHTKSQIEIENILNIQGIDIKIFSLKDKNQLVLKLLSKDDKDIFYILCKDILNSTKSIIDERITVRNILKRLEKWQYFLKNKKKLINKIALKGLIGELYFFKKYILSNFDIQEALEFWKAPLDFVHDFEISNITVEVKSKSSTNSITISSYEQMFTELDKLYLFVVSMNESTKKVLNSINIYDIIDEVKELIYNHNPLLIDKFEILLLNYGFIPLDEYKEIYFVIVSDEFYEVRDNFPKIDSIPNGVEKLTYKINLDICKEFLVEGDIFKNE